MPEHPEVGDNVRYVDKTGRELPGEVLKVHDERSVDLRVTDDGTEYLARHITPGAAGRKNSWFWPAE